MVESFAATLEIGPYVEELRSRTPLKPVQSTAEHTSYANHERSHNLVANSRRRSPVFLLSGIGPSHKSAKTISFQPLIESAATPVGRISCPAGPGP